MIWDVISIGCKILLFQDLLQNFPKIGDKIFNTFKFNVIRKRLRLTRNDKLTATSGFFMMYTASDLYKS